jgi:hypothetical protein
VGWQVRSTQESLFNSVFMFSSGIFKRVEAKEGLHTITLTFLHSSFCSSAPDNPWKRLKVPSGSYVPPSPIKKLLFKFASIAFYQPKLAFGLYENLTCSRALIASFCRAILPCSSSILASSSCCLKKLFYSSYLVLIF